MQSVTLYQVPLLSVQTEIEAIRDDIAPTWLQHPLSLEQTADKYVRPSLQQVKTATLVTLKHATMVPYLLPKESLLCRMRHAAGVCSSMRLLPSDSR